ncbi:DUF4214 domain-containing protein [Dankookia rubra]|uniref:DUF4214 domain-containing protein n=1 Tax=Dankookia rubra TaxID=1442381 RepID=A0A4R5QCS8_9PROT|nr:DUF4214 domain-containing protein [Dankookia rubra]TDH60934.1 DUF4214 domain-containing protein [Dankookia rubra]
MPRALVVSGVLPATMVENSRPGDWAATLSLGGDLAGLTGVELLGCDALSFGASLLPGLDAVRIIPGAMVDFESLAGPVLNVSLRLSFADGSTWDDPVTRSVSVLDVDDTAPTGLTFASGGTVVAGAIGAAIGRLAVADPDTLAGFRFSVGPDDDWRFEVVDGVLKLREGISLGLDDMPQRPLIVEVSDGHQSAAFLLPVAVVDPDARLADLPPGATRGGFGLVEAGAVLALRESRDLAQLDALASGERLLTLQEGTQVVLPAVQRVQFVDGFQDVGAGSTGVQAAALVQALGSQAAEPRALAGLVARAEAGVAWTDIAAGLGGLGGTDADAVGTLYRNALGRDPGEAELATQLGRLAAGVSRAQLAVDLALGAESLGHQPEGGVWVADALGTDGAWRAGTGGPSGPATPPPAAATDQVWLF